jgi:ABC-2 type transport system permease protein
MFTHILKYKFLSFIHTDFDFTPRLLIRKTGNIFIYGLFSIGAFFFTKNMIEYVLVTQRIGQFLMHEFISIILFMFFIAVHVGNIIVSYSTMFKSEEVHFLFTKPVKPSVIFSIKFLDNFFYSSTTLILILISVFTGYAVYFDLSISSFLIILFLNIIPFLISAGALGVIILLIIMKLAIKIGLRKIFITLGLFYLSFLIGFFQIASPVDLVNEVFKYYPDINRYFAELIPPFIKYLPNHWLSDSLFWMVNENFDQALQPIIMQNSFAIMLIMIALFLGKRWYYSIWLTSFRKVHIKRKKEQGKIHNLFEKDSIFKPQAETLIKKDWLTFLREPSQVIHFIVLMVLILLFISSVSSVVLIGQYNYYLQSIVYMTVFLFNVLLISTLSLRFVFPIISLEGITFWKIKTSPVNIHKYFFIRLMPYIILIFIISQLLSVFSNYQYSIHLKIMSALINALIVTGLIFINFGLGAYFADYKEKNPIRIASSQGASITFLIVILFLVALIAGSFRPFLVYFESLAKFRIYNISALLEVSIYIAIVSILVSIIFYRIALRSLKKDF